MPRFVSGSYVATPNKDKPDPCEVKRNEGKENEKMLLNYMEREKMPHPFDGLEERDAKKLAIYLSEFVGHDDIHDANRSLREDIMAKYGYVLPEERGVEGFRLADYLALKSEVVRDLTQQAIDETKASPKQGTFSMLIKRLAVFVLTAFTVMSAWAGWFGPSAEDVRKAFLMHGEYVFDTCDIIASSVNVQKTNVSDVWLITWEGRNSFPFKGEMKKFWAHAMPYKNKKGNYRLKKVRGGVGTPPPEA